MDKWYENLAWAMVICSVILSVGGVIGGVIAAIYFHDTKVAQWCIQLANDVPQAVRQVRECS